MHPAHFVERHGLIVIIAIGESLVAIGFGARDDQAEHRRDRGGSARLRRRRVFWLAYFDFFTIRAERLLSDRSGAPRTALARDTYTYLHLPMVIGIVLFAFAMKTTLAHIGDDLPTVPAVALCCGPALYLLAFVAVRVRVSGHLGGGRLVAGIACVRSYPSRSSCRRSLRSPLVAAVWLALHAYELIWWRDARAETRSPSRPAAQVPQA